MTTSLPEQIGRGRNGDDRFSRFWDAPNRLQAMLAAGCIDGAKAWRDRLLRAVAGDPAELQGICGLDGSRRLSETELHWLCRYTGFAPVRVANAGAG